MSSRSRLESAGHHVAHSPLSADADLLQARQLARLVARGAGLSDLDQTRMATAVSEVARNAISHGGGGRLDFFVETASGHQRLVARVSDEGPGLPDVAAALESRHGGGLAGTRTLVDSLQVSSVPGEGAVITVALKLGPERLDGPALEQLSEWLATVRAPSPSDELERQNRELVAALEALETRTRRLEAVNRELDAFARSASHDLRAPLRSIGGFAAALKEESWDDLGPTGRTDLDRIIAAAHRMSQIIDGLLKLARVSNAEVILESVDLSALAENEASALRTAEPDRTFEFRVEPGMLAVTDRQLAAVLLENLLGNAAKFTRTRGTAVVEFGTETSTDGPVYFVRDNGVGFDMRYAHNLFVAFKRLHSAAEFAGDGLGLATVGRIVARLGGQVWAEGHPDEGAVFRFSL